jgi:hypothetical protein
MKSLEKIFQDKVGIKSQALRNCCRIMAHQFLAARTTNANFLPCKSAKEIQQKNK